MLEEKQCFSVELDLSSQDGWGGICDVSYPTSIPHAWLTAHLFPLGRFPPPPAPALAPLLLLSHRVVSRLFAAPWTCSLPGSSVHGISPGKDTGAGCHFLLQGISPTQESNLHLLHRQADSLPLSHLGSPWAL